MTKHRPVYSRPTRIIWRKS